MKIARFDVPSASGVYCLFQDGICVYVGISVNLRQRISSHNHRGKFNSVTYVELPVEKLEDEEQRLLDEFSPELNIRRQSAGCNRRVPFDSVVLRLNITGSKYSKLQSLAKKEKIKLTNLAKAMIEEGIESRSTIPP